LNASIENWCEEREEENLKEIPFFSVQHNRISRFMYDKSYRKDASEISTPYYIELDGASFEENIQDTMVCMS
jgi:hypothetical protein